MGISGRECARRLGISEGQIRKDRRDGCPVFPDGSYDVKAVGHWRATKRGDGNNPAGTVRTEVRTGTHVVAHHDDDCGLPPPPSLKADAQNYYSEAGLAPVDLVLLSQHLQEKVPQLSRCNPETAAAVRRAIRKVFCSYSEGDWCPHCRRAVGIVEPPEPEE